ncbi:hypothetical protein D3C81_1406930 [compost metagenome]
MHTQVDDLASAVDAFAVEDLELGLTERRRHLVLHHLDAGFATDHLVAFLHRAGAADVQADRGVELQRVAAGGGFRVAEHHADLHADLVDENHQAVGILDVAGDLAQGLGHQTCLQANMGVTHLALDFRLGHQRRHGVDDDHIDRIGAHQHVGDLQGLLAGVRLRDQQVVDIDTELGGVVRVQRVLGIDKGAGGAQLLCLGDHRQGQGGLARGLRTVDLDDPALGQTADTEGDIQPQRAGGNGRNRLALVVAHAHDRALTELTLDLTQGRGQGALLVLVH